MNGTLENTTESHQYRGARVKIRQQVLILFLSGSDLNSGINAWSFHDGTSKGKAEQLPIDMESPYNNGVEALRDGWKLISSPSLSPTVDIEKPFDLGHLPYEYIFEKIIHLD
jgi:hypothetical protein